MARRFRAGAAWLLLRIDQAIWVNGGQHLSLTLRESLASSLARSLLLRTPFQKREPAARGNPQTRQDKTP